MATVAIIETVDSISANTLLIRGIFTDQATFKTPFDTTLSGNLTQEGIRSRLASILSEQESQGEVKKILTAGAVIDLTPPIVKPPDPPPPPPDPTSEELAKQVYRDLLTKYRQLNGALAVGIDVQAKLDTILVDLQKAYISDYDDLFVGSLI